MAERLYIRVDATAATGLGHFMRCLALAEAWQDLAGPVSFIGRFSEQTLTRLDDEGFEHLPIDAAADLTSDLAATLGVIPAGAPIVLDGYAFDPDYQRGLAAQGRLLTIDDIGQWSQYAGILLLNQNPHAGSVRYRSAPAQRLLGCEYAMLTRDYVRAPQRRIVAGTARDWLVTLGGSDPDNAAAGLVDALAGSALQATIRLVVGPLNPHGKELAALARRHSNLQLLQSPANMRRVLSEADLAVSAAGSTAYQLARLGVPMLLVAIADNQEPVGRFLDTAGACVYLGRWPRIDNEAIARAIHALAVDASKRAAMGDCGRRLIDGNGARRVAVALMATAPKTN